MYTKEDLKNIIVNELGEYNLIVVSNREPYIHTIEKDKMVIWKPTGGAVTALDPVMRACGGTWIAHGSGSQDKKVVDKDDKIRVPVENPLYTLKRVWLDKEEEKGYYYGFANEALWPLSHISYTRPVFRESDWLQYQKVNKKFAEAVLDEARHSDKKKTIVWLQDFHLALAAKYIKKKKSQYYLRFFLAYSLA